MFVSGSRGTNFPVGFDFVTVPQQVGHRSRPTYSTRRHAWVYTCDSCQEATIGVQSPDLFGAALPLPLQRSSKLPCNLSLGQKRSNLACTSTFISRSVTFRCCTWRERV
jgi:hypothetical protein